MKTLVRETRETRVEVALALEETQCDIRTTVPFLNHMLATLARYAGVGLSVDASGDLRHHLVEDVAITVGTLLRDAVASDCARFAHRVVPMDDALVEATLDLGGRSYYRGPLPSSLYDHWMRSFAEHAKCTLHLRVLRGRDRHHVIEAAFKALGLGLRDALKSNGDVLSTKGSVQLRSEC